MKRFSLLRKKLPLSNQMFTDIRALGKIYVDKTSLIFDLAMIDSPVFFSRPRRFGKSTVVSVLEELFTHGVEPYDGHDSYFKGLAIEKLWSELPNNNGPVNVMHLDFSKILMRCESVADFSKKLDIKLMRYAQEFGVDLAFEDPLEPDPLFERLISRMPDNSVVLLIDEYDAPLTAYIDDDSDEGFNAAAAVLRELFTTIKTCPNKFRFMFFTGITRYKDAAIFTAGNTVLDISQDPDFGTLCGLTREEIKQYFPDHLSYAAAQVFLKDEAAVTEADKEKLLDELALWYDGCCFDEECLTHVFSTWSVLSFFFDSRSRFKNYWFESGGLPLILRKAFFSGDWTKTISDVADDEVSVSTGEFLDPVTLSSMNRMVLLFQTGYLTIKAPYGEDDQDVQLGLPNREMRSAIKRLMCYELLRDHQIRILSVCREKVTKAVAAQNAALFQEILNELLRGVDYDHYPFAQESALVAFVKLFLHMSLDVRVATNFHEAGGRSDLLFDLKDTTVVIEFKYVRDNSEQVLENKLDEAAAQIKDRRYGETLERQPKLWRLAMVFSYEARKITHTAAVD